MASLLFLFGLALTIAGIVFLIGRTNLIVAPSLAFVIPYDWFGVIQYFLIFVGLFLMVLDRMSKLEPNGSFWGMKYSRTKKV